MGMALAAGGVKYTSDQALTPNTPSASTSVPTSRNAPITRPMAPPGKFLIRAPGLTSENFQMNSPSKIWPARKAMPASTMVSAICSSIKWPWTETSAGATHVCITMGTADRTAIRMMVTARILPIVPASARPAAGINLVVEPPNRVAAAPPRGMLLGLESEADCGRFAGRNRHFLCLRAVGLVPCRQGVSPGRHVIQRERTAGVAHPVRALYHHHVAVHPGMNVALHRDSHLFRLPAGGERRRALRLGFVPADIAPAHLWQRVDVVRCRVAVYHLQLLAYIHTRYMGLVHATLLVPHDRFGGYGSGGGSGKTLRYVDHHVGQATAGTYHNIFQPRRRRVLLGTGWVFGHVNGTHVRRRSLQLDSAADLAFRGRIDVYSGGQQSQRDHDQHGQNRCGLVQTFHGMFSPGYLLIWFRTEPPVHSG